MTQVKVVRVLCETGADLNATPAGMSPPLVIAVDAGDEEVVRLLCEAGVDTKAGPSKHTAMVVAAVRGNVTVMRHLLAAGANTAGPLVAGYNSPPLVVATRNRHAEIVRLLCEAGADIEAPGKSGSTALMNAAQFVHADVVRALCQAGTYPTVKSHSGCSVLRFALEEGRKGNVEVVRELVRAGGAPPRVLNEGAPREKPLFEACERGHRDLARELLRAGANPLIDPDDTGLTALHVAAFPKTGA